MTLAICLRCGEMKVGALTDCPVCGTGPSGDLQLDILFSDHRMSHEDLNHFSEVVRKISDATPGFPEAFRGFMVHMGTHYSEVVTIDLPVEDVQKAKAVLDGLDLNVRELKLRPPGGWANLGARPLPTGLVLSVISAVLVVWALNLEPVNVSPLLDVRLLLIGSLAMFFGLAAIYQFVSAWRTWRESRSSP